MTFREWFDAQHGPRPSPEAAHVLIKRATELRTLADIAERTAYEVHEWDRRETSARWAWNVLEKDKQP